MKNLSIEKLILLIRSEADRLNNRKEINPEDLYLLMEYLRDLTQKYRACNEQHEYYSFVVELEELLFTTIRKIKAKIVYDKKKYLNNYFYRHLKTSVETFSSSINEREIKLVKQNVEKTLNLM